MSDEIKEIKLIPTSKAVLFGYKNKKGRFIFEDYVKRLPFIPLLVNDAYFDEYGREETFNLWFGGMNSGKSYEKAAMCLFKAHTLEFYRLLYCRKQSVDIRKSQYQLFLDIIKNNGLSSHFRWRDSDMTIVSVRTGNRLMAAGLDNIDKLKSINDITEVWIEEPINKKGKKGANVLREDFNELDRRLRTDKADLSFSLTFNPIDKNNWIYEDFFNEETRKYDKGRVRTLQTTYKDNFFTSKKMLQTVGDQRGNDYTVYSLGMWGTVKTGTEWLHRYRPEIHVRKVKYLEGHAIHATFDFNITPYMSALLVQFIPLVDTRTNKRRLQIRIFKEYALKNPHNNSASVCKQILRDYFQVEKNGKLYNRANRPDLYYYGDASGEFRVPGISNKQGGEVRAFDEVREGFKGYLNNGSKRVIKRNPPVLRARDFINDLLDGKLDVEILIDENCKNLMLDFSDLKDGIDGFLKEIAKNEAGVAYEKYGHLYSALVYLLAYHYPQMYKYYKHDSPNDSNRAAA